MKKKGVLIAGAIGFVAVVSLFARQTQDIVTTTGGGIGGHMGQGSYNTGFVPLDQGGSPVPVPSGFAGGLGVVAPTPEQLLADHEKGLAQINKELKDPNITPERKKYLKENKKVIMKNIEGNKQDIRELKKKKNGK